MITKELNRGIVFIFEIIYVIHVTIYHYIHRTAKNVL